MSNNPFLNKSNNLQNNQEYQSIFGQKQAAAPESSIERVKSDMSIDGGVTGSQEPPKAVISTIPS
jgi:hypothetical protein